MGHDEGAYVRIPVPKYSEKVKARTRDLKRPYFALPEGCAMLGPRAGFAVSAATWGLGISVAGRARWRSSDVVILPADRRQETGGGRREAAGSCGIEDSETRAYRAMLGLDAYARVLEDSGPTHWGFLGT